MPQSTVLTWIACGPRSPVYGFSLEPVDRGPWTVDAQRQPKCTLGLEVRGYGTAQAAPPMNPPPGGDVVDAAAVVSVFRPARYVATAATSVFAPA